MAPRARVCYICGRQYMLHSFPIHEPQCRALFEAREQVKPEKERRPCPTDPYAENGRGGGKLGVGGPRSRAELDEMNAVAAAAWSSSALSECKHCGRRFLPEKLAIHAKSCNSSHPARRVNETVNRREALGLSTTGSQVVLPDHGRYNKDLLNQQLAIAAAAAGPAAVAAAAAAAATVPIRMRKVQPRPQHRPGFNPRNLSVGEAGFSAVLDSPSLAAASAPSFSSTDPSFTLPVNSANNNTGVGGAESERDYYDKLLRRRSATLRAVGGLGASATPLSSSAMAASLPPAGMRGSGGRRSITILEEAAGPIEVPRWKKDSSQFRNAIKLARLASMAEQAAKEGRVLEPPTRSPQTPELVLERDGVDCPHCGRRFPQQAAARHLPLCRDAHARPKQQQQHQQQQQQQQEQQARRASASTSASLQASGSSRPSSAAAAKPSTLGFGASAAAGAGAGAKAVPPKRNIPISRRPDWKGVGSEFLPPRDGDKDRDRDRDKDKASRPKPSVIEVDVSALQGGVGARRASFGLGAGSAGVAASKGKTAPRAASGDAKADARRRASFGGGALRK